MFQPSLSDLGQPLAETTFVVVDLETTGGSPSTDRITEIGAVKVRAGELLGELATLVDPGRSVPAAITMLTGISDRTVTGRPGIAAVLPSFLEFSRGATLVAHNARFDITFLNAALARLDHPPLDHPVVCTAQLARRLVGDEVRDRRLGTLANHFRSRTVPTHRALTDARATVDVLHGLLEQAGGYGVVTVADLVAFSRVRNMPLFTSRRRMADDLPQAPGVYRFISASGEVLYVGKATDLRARVRQYFGTDTRRRIAALVREASRVSHTVTPTAVEAEILESRLIREHRPRFNARGKRIRTPVWLTLTSGPYARLSITRTPPAVGRIALGPLPSRRVAESVMDAITDAVPIRRCSQAMKAKTRFDACALAEMGRCVAPCVGRSDPKAYALIADTVADVLGGRVTPVLEVLASRMAARAAEGRFEDAAQTRDRIDVLLTWIVRSRRDQALRGAGIVAASRPAGRQREVLVQRAGWLLGTAVVVPEDIHRTVAGFAQAAPPDTPAPPEEVAALQRWLAADDVVIEHADGPLAWPIDGGAGMADAQSRIAAARRRTGRPESHLAGKRLHRSGQPA